MNWDKDFNEIPLSSKILGELYQGGTEEEVTIYSGDKRLRTVGDPRPFDSVVYLCAYTFPVGSLRSCALHFLKARLSRGRFHRLKLLLNGFISSGKQVIEF